MVARAAFPSDILAHSAIPAAQRPNPPRIAGSFSTIPTPRVNVDWRKIVNPAAPRASRPYVAGHGAYARAYDQGRRFWRAHYGEQLLAQIAQEAGRML